MEYMHTALVPIYNRAALVKERIPIYVKQMEERNITGIKFIVLDSSVSDEDKQSNKDVCKRYGIEYHCFGSDILLMEKINSFFKLKDVTTYTAQLIDIDDIMSISAMIQFSEFLNNNRSYAVAWGINGIFKDEVGGMMYADAYDTHSLHMPSPLERLHRIVNPNFISLTYTIMTTTALKTSYETMEEFNITGRDGLSLEVMTSLLPVAIGKLKKFDVFQVARYGEPNWKTDYIRDISKYFMSDERLGINFTEILHNQKKCLIKVLGNSIDSISAAEALDFILTDAYRLMLNRNKRHISDSVYMNAPRISLC